MPDVTTCNHCAVTVIPNDDGICPSCGEKYDSPRKDGEDKTYSRGRKPGKGPVMAGFLTLLLTNLGFIVVLFALYLMFGSRFGWVFPLPWGDVIAIVVSSLFALAMARRLYLKFRGHRDKE